MTTKKIKILIVVESLDINDSSATKGRVALINNLHDLGFQLKVYHYTQKEINLPSIECVAIPEKKWNCMYLLSRMERIFSRWTGINLNPFLEGFFGFSFTFFNDTDSMVKALKNENDFMPDLVLTLSKGDSFRPHYALLKLIKWHSKWLAYVHDPYPMHSYPRPYDWVEPGHKYKRNFFLEIVEKSKYVLYPSKFLAEWMQSYYHNQNGKEIIIPHQISLEKIDLNFLPAYFNPNDFNILHAGNMMSARNPTSLIEAFENFLEQNPDAKKQAKLSFIGNYSCFDSYIKEKQQTLPQLFLSDGYVSFKIVLAMQQVTSVNVILEALGSFSPFLPGKFPHCIQAKRPILLLGPFYSESKRLLGDDYPYWSSIDDVEQIQNHINRLYHLWKENKNQLTVNREDLNYYLSSSYLQKTINELIP